MRTTNNQLNMSFRRSQHVTSREVPEADLRHPHNGFSLVETLVAITILLIAITAPITIVVRSTQSSQFSSEQVVATFLAQEGVELVQKARDDGFLRYFDELFNNPPPTWAWTGFADFAAEFGESCRVADETERGCGLYLEHTSGDTGIRSVGKCSEALGCRVYFDDRANARLRYTHEAAGNDPTPFYREIKVVDADDNSRELRVVSTVRWQTGTLISTQQVVQQSFVFNIYDL